MKLMKFIIMAMLLSGCSSSYQSNGFSGGFSELKTGQKQYRITFKGNGFTSLEKVSDLSLLRAAELTIENGYSHFLVMNSDTDIIGGPTPMAVPNSAGFNRGFAQGYNASTGISKPVATINVLFLDELERDFSTGYQIYDAKFILSEIKKKYDIE